MYHLPGQSLPSADLTFGEMPLMSKAGTGDIEKSSGHKEDSSGHNDDNSGHKGYGSSLLLTHMPKIADIKGG